MPKNIAACGDFGGNPPSRTDFKTELLAALQPFGIEQLTIQEPQNGKSIFIFIGEVADNDVAAVYQAIEQVIVSFGGTYQYPDNK